ncbi:MULTISPECIES: hypothetical protein [unclassified Streptomyces]|uniref:hypothetical protein n=1 Tax=unclassified Streptomyces TaxID=2593676 RepID=UPI00093A6CEF|nr:hypothetical protein [Streptomyces sp. TSRI0281]OKI38354.1 hypothetical protein A6A29_10320 [Streptomyces sp. TSRI0281]
MLVAAAAAALSLTACGQPVDTPDDRGSSRGGSAPTAYGVVFLGPADCSSRGAEVREVSCRSEKAMARVLARHLGAATAGPSCPPPTDFVLHISETGDSARSRLTRGYACMRNLEPPHPGDPGQGGGPLTRVGDCVRHSRGGTGGGEDTGEVVGEVEETACDGSGARAPEFEVMSAVRLRARCPDTTDLVVTLGGDRAVGCARRI